MAKSWKEACWRAEQELAEYKETIVPALTERVRGLEAALREWERRGPGIGYAGREMTYTNALIRYGEENQLVVAIEELSELQKEVTKFLRGIGNAGNLAEETADALICIEQIIYIFGIREMVDVMMDRKVLRLDDKLREETDAHG